MYIERMLILVPPLAHPRLTYNWSDYFPSWVELTILAGSLALAILLYVLAIKFVPIISIWEEKEGRMHGQNPDNVELVGLFDPNIDLPPCSIDSETPVCRAMPSPSSRRFPCPGRPADRRTLSRLI